MILDRKTRKVASKQLSVAAINIQTSYNLLCSFHKVDWGDVLTPKEKKYLDQIQHRLFEDTQHLMKLSHRLRAS